MSVISDELVMTLAASASDSLADGLMASQLEHGGRRPSRAERNIRRDERKRRDLAQRIAMQLRDMSEAGEIGLTTSCAVAQTRLSLGIIESWLLSAVINLLVEWIWDRMRVQMRLMMTLQNEIPRP